MKNNNTYFSDVIPYLVDYYNQFETLPTKVLECTKGTGAYTCFGTNLKTKVEKAGGIEKLLRSFVGRGAKKSQKVEAKMEARTKKTHKVKVVDTVQDVITEVETIA
jgi:hypothetical protein